MGKDRGRTDFVNRHTNIFMPLERPVQMRDRTFRRLFWTEFCRFVKTNEKKEKDVDEIL